MSRHITTVRPIFTYLRPAHLEPAIKAPVTFNAAVWGKDNGASCLLGHHSPFSYLQLQFSPLFLAQGVSLNNLLPGYSSQGDTPVTPHPTMMLSVCL